MSAIRVDTRVYEELAQRLCRVENTIQDSRQSLSSVRGYAQRCVSKRTDILGELQRTLNRINEKYSQTRRLRYAALKAADQFAKCERKLSGKGEVDDTKNTGATAKAKYYIKNKGGGKSDGKLPIKTFERFYPTEAKEKARDAEMQEQLHDLLTEFQFSAFAWVSASMEKRKKILENAITRMNEIYGTDVSSEIEYFYDDLEDRLIKHGEYSSGSNSIRMNTFDMGSLNHKNVMVTLMHEMRHAYQYAVVENPRSFFVTKETAQVWEENAKVENYVQPPGPEDYQNDPEAANEQYNEYRGQPIELDARNFSENVQINGMFAKTKTSNPVFEMLSKLFHL